LVWLVSAWLEQYEECEIDLLCSTPQAVTTAWLLAIVVKTPGKDGIDIGWSGIEDMSDSIPLLIAPAKIRAW